ncbi:fumarylacetoacetate hydrolase family protein [Yinghuangia seranimata]|uniref:fumarylacetoacetate hydrolase family protein n=1 Tax=Yinghuangia seranimata TaxID=408067 RepID=UPI00248CB300|nr:fumarylacetoacetate hydrolase family protein [Yinghuangia seranimata]MDI2129327.1 fumarylacetoacetate hydrolase family protein [Yinghuangia seranimata]
MRIVRFSTGDSYSFGAVGSTREQPGELVVAELDGHPYGGISLTGRTHPLADVQLLSPVLPSKVVAIGKNYADHAAEMGGEVPEVPIVFLKPSTAVIGPDAPVVYPDISNELSYEAELAVVIGRLCRDVPPERVPEVVFGYTCANDVTARDLQRTEGQWARAKGFDTSCPLGPWVETELDPADLAVTCTVNGELRQNGRTSQMVRSITDIVVHVTAAMTLLPGDVILTGTPAGVGPLQVGDEVAVTVEGIGTLTNRVIKRG